MQKEESIDCMKYRKSTHIAGVDVDMIIAEKGSCLVTIKEAYYAKGVNVSGNNTDGYFLEFSEDVKPMVVNSINRATISKIVKDSKGLTTTESRNIGNWIGLRIELTFDSTVKMMGKVTGGIRVKYQLPENNADDKEGLIMLGNCQSIEDLKMTWDSFTSEEKRLPTLLSKKEQLKKELK